MKGFTAATVAVIIAAAGVTFAGGNKPAGSPAQPNGINSNQNQTIADVAFADSNFKTFASLLKTTGLDKTFQGEGPFTVFAPTDEAFSKLPEGMLEELSKPENKSKLVDILKFHTLPGHYAGSAISNMKESSGTLQGTSFDIIVDKGTVYVGTNPKLMATIIKTDIQCSNGVIHSINGVLMPRR